MTSPPLLLAAALDDPRLAAVADDAGLDFVTLADDPLDATLVAARLAARTRRVGLLPGVSTTTTEPFHVSTAIATIDFVSGGRAGWVAEVAPSRDDADAQVTWDVPGNLVSDAREHLEAVRRLWDSWEDGAEIRDTTTDRFVDRERVHHINYVGEHLAVRGPSITPRPPQGQPVIAVRERALAAGADLWLTPDPGAPAVDGVLRILEVAGLDAVDAARDAGFDGVLLHGADVDALAALAALRSAPPAPAASLRERLGLPPATNRYAKAAA
ncbi:hypothetical protein DSM104299_02152 [Baekduia alba]|uniref:LLM class flavin-dependent oxidoreductase n=1 Tax=Baekduia alba TaxID=2997333 RepID=UPI00233FE516|nr:LLM class flavin-dependent oxidoreductase [Baekduia alba]WCB93439.1 hypothetical protein DSM104299_02152 [Baekduia alba]